MFRLEQFFTGFNINHFDQNYELTNRNGLFATLSKKLDNAGRFLMESSYDKDGNLTTNSNGYALVEARYDRNGMKIETVYALEEAEEYLTVSNDLSYLLNFPH